MLKVIRANGAMSALPIVELRSEEENIGVGPMALRGETVAAATANLLKLELDATMTAINVS